MFRPEAAEAGVSRTQHGLAVRSDGVDRVSGNAVTADAACRGVAHSVSDEESVISGSSVYEVAAGASIKLSLPARPRMRSLPPRPLMLSDFDVPRRLSLPFARC